MTTNPDMTPPNTRNKRCQSPIRETISSRWGRWMRSRMRTLSSEGGVIGFNVPARCSSRAYSCSTFSVESFLLFFILLLVVFSRRVQSLTVQVDFLIADLISQRQQSAVIQAFYSTFTTSHN